MRLLVFSTFLIAATCLNAQDPADLHLQASDVIDYRIELVSIVYRLSGAEEYTNVNYPDRVFERYTQSIDEYFGHYAGHPAVQFAKKLKRQGIGYNYVMYLPLVITHPPDMKIAVPFTDDKPVSRWNLSTASKFLALLNQFYQDTNFEEFIEKNKPLFETSGVRFSEMISKVNSDWYTRFYGYGSKVEFFVINALGIGPYNYNVDVDFPSGQKSTYAILGASKTDSSGMPVYNSRYVNVLQHEFNHSFANPIILENEKDFKNSGVVIFRHFKKNRIAANEAYNNWQSVLCESLVRAAVINYMKENEFDHAEIERQIELEKRYGFPWVKDLTERLDYYAVHRETYPDMTDFMPELISFFERVGTNMDEYMIK